MSLFVDIDIYEKPTKPQFIDLIHIMNIQSVVENISNCFDGTNLIGYRSTRIRYTYELCETL